LLGKLSNKSAVSLYTSNTIDLPEIGYNSPYDTGILSLHLKLATIQIDYIQYW